jgi:hypothetical protein
MWPAGEVSQQELVSSGHTPVHNETDIPNSGI